MLMLSGLYSIKISLLISKAAQWFQATLVQNTKRLPLAIQDMPLIWPRNLTVCLKLTSSRSSNLILEK